MALPPPFSERLQQAATALSFDPKRYEAESVAIIEAVNTCGKITQEIYHEALETSRKQHLPIADYRIVDKQYGVCNSGWHYVSNDLKTNNRATDRGLIYWISVLPPLDFTVKVYFVNLPEEDIHFVATNHPIKADWDKEEKVWLPKAPFNYLGIIRATIVSATIPEAPC